MFKHRSCATFKSNVHAASWVSSRHRRLSDAKIRNTQTDESHGDTAHLPSPLHSAAKSGVSSSVAFRASSIKDDAKETAHAMANIHVHRRFHMRAPGNCM